MSYQRAHGHGIMCFFQTERTWDVCWSQILSSFGEVHSSIWFGHLQPSGWRVFFDGCFLGFVGRGMSLEILIGWGGYSPYEGVRLVVFLET